MIMGHPGMAPGTHYTRAVANPVADEKARSLERVVQRRDAQIVVAVVKNKKYQTPMFV